MGKFQRFLSSTRTELLLQFIFTIFVLLIPNQLIQLTVLGLGIIVISFMIGIKPKLGVSFWGRFKLLGKWVLIAGTGYFVLPLLWIEGLTFDINFTIIFFALIIFSVGILMLPIFFVGDYFVEVDLSSLGFIGWAVGAVLSLVLSYTGFTLVLLRLSIIPLFVVLFFVIFYAPASGLWLVSNLIAGITYTYLYINMFESNYLISGIIASISSAMISGLAYIVIYENRVGREG